MLSRLPLGGALGRAFIGTRICGTDLFSGRGELGSGVGSELLDLPRSA